VQVSMILNGSAHGFIYLIQSLKFDPGTQKKTLYVKCNKTITALHFVQYDVLWSTDKQY